MTYRIKNIGRFNILFKINADGTVLAAYKMYNYDILILCHKNYVK